MPVWCKIITLFYCSHICYKQEGKSLSAATDEKTLINQYYLCQFAG